MYTKYKLAELKLSIMEKYFRLISSLFIWLMSTSADVLLYRVSLSDNKSVISAHLYLPPESFGFKTSLNGSPTLEEIEEGNQTSDLFERLETLLAPSSSLTKRQRRMVKFSYADFPYKYEKVPPVYSEQIFSSNLKKPVKLKDARLRKKSKTGLRKRVADKQGHSFLSATSRPTAVDRIDMDDDVKHMVQSFDLQPIQKIFPAFGPFDQRHPFSQLFPFKKLSKIVLDFIGILAAIAVKILISTALATWFLLAGQSLYSIAAITGTTAVFGQESTIGYIYKTLPLVEAILRGETMFSHHH